MFITRPGATLHVGTFGHGELELLAVGGWIAGGELWHPVFGHLPGWRCVGVDHWGTGASVRQGPICVDDMAEDLVAIADALDLQRCVLAAESSGAAAALRAVQRAPGRFAGLVLVGAAWQRTLAGASDAFAEALRRDPAATLHAFIDRCLPETDNPDLRRWALQVLMRSSVDDAVELLRCRERIEEPGPHDWPCVPTLVIHGDRDAIAPVQGARALCEHLADAELHVLPGLGHVPLVTAPADVASLIDRFCRRVAGPA